MFKPMQRGNFDSFNGRKNKYDPDMYDPSLKRRNNADGDTDAGSTIKTAQPGNKMQVNLTFNNPTAQNLTFEAWSFLDSFTRRKKAEYAVGNYTYIPQTSYQGIKAIAAGTDQTVGFDQLGDLVIRGLLADPVATLKCKEIAYAAFFEASGITPFEVAYFRYKVSADAQIDEPIVYFQKSFSGGVLENPIDPRSYQKPSNFNELLIDIPVSFTIGIDKGIRMLVQATQSVKLSLFIVGWTTQTLNQ